MSQGLDPFGIFKVARRGGLDDLLKYLENNPPSYPCDSTPTSTDPPKSQLSSTNPNEIEMSLLKLSESESSTSGPSEITSNVSAMVNVTTDSGETALWFAAADCHELAMRTLISAGADVNKACNPGQTPLMMVAGTFLAAMGRRNMQENCVKLLIDAGADLNAKDNDGWTALMVAATADSVNCIQLLLKAGADVGIVDNKGQTALMLASASGSHSSVEVLVKEPNCQKDAKCESGKTALMCAVEGFKKHGKTIKMFLPPGDRHVDFYYECVKLLVEGSADVNIRDKDGKTVVMHVSTTDNMVDYLRVMLQADGVDKNLQDSKGMTAIMHAVSSGSPECLQCLITSGASVNAVGYLNKTPLNYFLSESEHKRLLTETQCFEILKILLDAGADVNAGDDGGVTPLMHVAQKPFNPHYLCLLVNHGANVNLVDKEGRSALLYALELEHPLTLETLNYLLQNGADPNVKPLRGHSALACAIHTKDLTLLKLLVEHGVEMKVEWDEFQELLNSTGHTREILQLLITNGMMPTTQVSSTGEHCTSSFIQSALKKGSNIDTAKYFIAISYLRNDDLSFIFHSSSVESALPRDSFGHQSVQLLMAALCSQPWPLVKLCFVTVSTLLGASPGRHERIKKSQLPNKIQDMLSFNDSESRLCHYKWNRIRLTFNPGQYERLPCPRPLLYNWPVGRRLVTCKCGKCDGTMYKYEKDDQQSDSDSE